MEVSKRLDGLRNGLLEYLKNVTKYVCMYVRVRLGRLVGK